MAAIMNRIVFYTFIAALSVANLTACSTPKQVQQLANAPELAPCPDTPNCVSSLASDPAQQVEAFVANNDNDWQRLQTALLNLPRSYPLARAEHYLHVEVHSAVMRFRDDVELRYHPEQQRVDVRSASRLGRYDFGVNQQRVESLREHYHRREH